MLYAKPLPASAEVETALRLSEEKRALAVKALLACMRARQAEIREVSEAFERIPTAVFGMEADRARARAALVREGIFRELSNARAGGQSVPALAAVAEQQVGVKAVRGHRELLQRWIKLLGGAEEEPASAEGYCERFAWAEDMGLPVDQVELLTEIVEEATARMVRDQEEAAPSAYPYAAPLVEFAGIFLDPREIDGWPNELEQYGWVDLADRVREIRAQEGAMAA